jgi:hypothetical protein
VISADYTDYRVELANAVEIKKLKSGAALVTILPWLQYASNRNLRNLCNLRILFRLPPAHVSIQFHQRIIPFAEVKLCLHEGAPFPTYSAPQIGPAN